MDRVSRQEEEDSEDDDEFTLPPALRAIGFKRKGNRTIISSATIGA